MKPLEPGDPFQIEYGNGHRLTVHALNGRAKRKITQLLGEIGSLEESEEGAIGLYDLAEECLRNAVPDQADSLIEKTDESQQLEIAGKVVANARLSADERKKQGLRRSSGAAQSASPAKAAAKKSRRKS